MLIVLIGDMKILDRPDYYVIISHYLPPPADIYLRLHARSMLMSNLNQS